VLPRFMADAEPRLQRVLPKEITLTRSFHIITHSDIRNLARIQIVSDFIAQEVRAAAKLFMPS
jgi:DNA-binding transcriptional LysR family regulator